LEIESNVSHLRESAKLVGLEINKDKTEAMITGRKAEKIGTQLSNRITGFKIVESFKYLGSIFNSQADLMPEIKARIMSAKKPSER
jgi:hypothetical protein